MAQPSGACCGEPSGAGVRVSGRVEGMLHVSVRKKSEGRMHLEVCNECKLYHCPFCRPDVYKPKAEYASVWTHVEIHRMRALKHGEYNIHVCQLKCRKDRHFHCPYCVNTLMSRKQFETHMDKCSVMSKSTSVPTTAPVSGVTQAGTTSQYAYLLVNLPPRLHQNVVPVRNIALNAQLNPTSGQPPPPPEPTTQCGSASLQSFGPTEPPSQPKSPSDQPVAPSEPTTQPKSTSDQPVAPSEPPTQNKSTSHQPVVPSEPSTHPKSSSDQCVAPSEPSTQTKSSLDQPVAPSEPSTSEQPADLPEPPMQPTSTFDDPPEPLTHPKSSPDQSPAPPDPLYLPQSSSDPPSATPKSTSEGSLFQQKSTFSQFLPPPDQTLEHTSAAFKPADFPDPLVQPTTPAAHPSSLTGRFSKQTRQMLHTGLSKIKCPLCNLYLNPKNLRIHNLRKHLISERDITAKAHLRSQCIDAHKGVYAVSKSYKATAMPLHVVKRKSGSACTMVCEDDCCTNISDFRKRSGLPESQCPHLRSVDFCLTRAKAVDLKPDVLEELVIKKMILKDMVSQCLNHQELATQNRTPLIALVDLGGDHCLYLSVFEPNMMPYSRFGRLLVTFTIKGKLWRCVCSRGRVSCLHRSIAKWFLFQTKAELFSLNANQDASLSISELMEDSPEAPSTETAPGNVDPLRQMAGYIYNQKKIPNTISNDFHQLEHEMLFQKHLVPAESVCQVCTGHVLLTEPLLITNKAVAITLTGVTGDNSTFSRKCPDCQMVYRYQEWSEGLHNYNNHIILSLQLCILLQNSIKNYGADGVVEVLERTVGVNSSCGMEVLKAYLHFESLTSHTCKPEVMLDLHKKGLFHMAGFDIKDLPESFTGEENAEDLWDKACLEIIASSLEACSSIAATSDSTLRAAAMYTASTSYTLAEKKKLTKQRTDECHRAVARFLVKGLHPVSTVEMPWFREMTETLNPKYRPPSRDQLVNSLIPSLYLAEKKRVIKELLQASKAALTCDQWMSINCEHYRTISLHFIVKGELKQKVLRTMQVYDAQTDTARIGAVLKEFGVEGKVVAITVGNAFSMDRGVKKLKFKKMRCFAQILSAAAQKVYTSNTVAQCAAKVTAVMAWMKSLVMAQVVLQEKQKLLNVPQQSLVIDNQAHWNSLYLMMERFMEQYAAIQATAADPRIQPTIQKKGLEMVLEDDLCKAVDFIRTMKPLYMSTLCVSADKSPSCSQIFPILKKLESHFEPQNEDSLFTVTLKENVWDELSTCYKDSDTWKFLQESSALDPRFKNSVDSDEIWYRLKVAAIRAASPKEVSNSKEPRLSPEDSNGEYSDEPLCPKKPRLSALEELFEEEDRALKSRTEEVRLSVPDRVQQEILTYRKLPAIPTSEDALAWWWERRTTMPFLSELSNSYLCVQASSTPRERVFSAAGDTVSQERSHILTEKVDMQIFLQKNT